MGKPATTYFCGNGHITDEAAHHEFCDRDNSFGMPDKSVNPCPTCGDIEEFCDTLDHHELVYRYE